MSFLDQIEPLKQSALNDFNAAQSLAALDQEGAVLAPVEVAGQGVCGVPVAITQTDDARPAVAT